MPYICGECDVILDSEWCDLCERQMDHVCKIEYERQWIDFGSQGRTKKMEYNYCDECGFFEIIN